MSTLPTALHLHASRVGLHNNHINYVNYMIIIKTIICISFL